jgi:hypothetical protein
VNQNVVISGQINIDSSHTSQLTGTRYIQLLSGSDNTNTFIGQDLENSMAQNSLECQGEYNIFVNPRFEANQSGAVVFSAASTGNTVMGGDWPAAYGTTMTDSGTNNNFFGANGILLNPTNGFSIGSQGTTGKFRIDKAGSAGFEYRLLNSQDTLTGISAAGFQIAGSVYGLSGAGCSISGSPVGGVSGGSFVTTTTGVCTVTVNFAGSTTANHGWNCSVSDITSGVAGAQSASSTTTAQLKVATTNGDTVTFFCVAF